MKKILLLATATLALLFASCNHEPDFDGFKEYRPGNLLKLQLPYGGTYTATDGFNAGEDASEDPKAVAKLKIEEWLNAEYYSAEKGSEAVVKYNLITKTTEKSEVASVDVDFNGNITVYADTEIPGWTNFKITGSYTWQDNSYSGNSYTQCGNVKAFTNTWLISPQTLIAKGDKLSFDVCMGYWKGDVLSVLISEDYSGAASKKNIEKAEWTNVTAKFKIPQEPAKGYGTLATAGALDLSAYVGKKIYIAFQYKGDKDKSTTVQLDNIKVAHEQTTVTTTSKVKEARAVVDNNSSTWTVTLPSNIPDVLLDETFEDGIAKKDIALENWANVKVKGNRAWQYASFSNNMYASLTAFKLEGDLEAWMITPQLLLGKDMVLKFDFEYRYLAGDVFALLLSTDYTGDPAVATWKDITPATLDKNNDKSFTSYSVDLKAYTKQKIYIGFRYIGNGATGVTTTCQLDNIYVGIPK